MLESLQTGVFEYEKLKPEEMQRRGILGRLVGVMADSKNPTRNGRAYSKQLWENVFSNPIMQERIENKCCFGELGHPTDREETDMEKIAICMDGVPKLDPDGKLKAVFNILDTPNGRILKTLCDYGCNIGISSRGSGDLIEDFDGNESVDPDTYNCEGWDAVLIPAVKEARLQYVNESLEKIRYKKSLRTRLQEAVNKEDVDKKKAMTESLHTFLGESIWDEIENDTDVTEPEVGPEPNEDYVDDLDINSGEADDFGDAGMDLGSDDFGDAGMDLGSDDLGLDDFGDSDLSLDDDMSGDLFSDPLEADPTKSFEYKGIQVLQDPETGKFVCEIDQDTYVFNSEKNAKIWIDMNSDKIPETIESQHDEDVRDEVREFDTDSPSEEPIDTDLIDEKGNPVEEPADEEEPMQESLVEEQIGRDEPKADKDISEVQEPSAEETTEDEEDTDKIVIPIQESVSYPSEDEDRVSDFVVGYITENPINDPEELDNIAGYMTELDNNAYGGDVDPLVVVELAKEKLNLNESLKQNTLNYNESIAEEAGNARDDVGGLHELLEQNISLEKKTLSLQEKLSAGNARERKLIEELSVCKEKLAKMSSVTKENDALKAQLAKAKNSAGKLNESVESKNSKLKSLKEQLQKVTDERNSSNSELEALRENYSNLDKDFTQIKEQYSKRFDKQNKLLEKYQKITKNAVDKYINMQATNLGVKSTEIRNRLPEQFSFSDIDSICEELRSYKLNVSKLPFNTSRSLKESQVRYQNPGRNLAPKNEMDELNDYDLKLLEMYK